LRQAIVIARHLAAAAFLALAACATFSVVDQAREYMHAGRGEEALALLEDARRQAPNEPQLRTEYFRLRDLMLAQWLSQAEPLRLAGRFEVAEDLYRRIATGARSTFLWFISRKFRRELVVIPRHTLTPQR